MPFVQHLLNIYVFLTLGPLLPKALKYHSMLEIHGDAYIFGGYPSNSAIYQLSCSSGICSWSINNQELKVARYWHVAIPVLNHFCLEEGEGTTTTATTLYGCGIPPYANDQWCDDENNNPSCNFDGGVCCNNNNSGWDTYCTVIYKHVILFNNPHLTYFLMFAEM